MKEIPLTYRCYFRGPLLSVEVLGNFRSLPLRVVVQTVASSLLVLTGQFVLVGERVWPAGIGVWPSSTSWSTSVHTLPQVRNIPANEYLRLGSIETEPAIGIPAQMTH